MKNQKNKALWVSVGCAAAAGMIAVISILESPCWQANLSVLVGSFAYLALFYMVNFLRKEDF